MQVLWMNVYRSGFYHRMGKPGCVDCHAGDFYESQRDAMADIGDRDHYMGTVSFEWNGEPMKANGPESKPIPLSVTRLQRQQQQHSV